MLFNVADPVANVVEAALVRDIVHQQNSHGSSIISRCNRAETFLSSCVPDLELDTLRVEVNGANFKVNANGCNETRCKRVVREPKKQATLSNSYSIVSKPGYACKTTQGARARDGGMAKNGLLSQRQAVGQQNYKFAISVSESLPTYQSLQSTAI